MRIISSIRNIIMNNARSPGAALTAALWFTISIAAAAPQDSTAPPPQAQPPAQAGEAQIIDATSPPPRPRTLTQQLLDRIDELLAENQRLRTELAEAELDRDEAERELTEVKQFLADHEELGHDFERYLAVKRAAEEDAKSREREQRRAEYEQRKAEREAAQAAARAARQRENAEQRRVREYRQAGFTPIGLDVYTGKMAFFYRTNDSTQERVDYDTDIGHYLRLYPNRDIDYSRMTISGSVMNAASEVRNIGIAITFFDDNGNQVGSETIQINNARPEVPYPFTSEIDMALNRPFTSSSTYVLYADPIAPPQ